VVVVAACISKRSTFANKFVSVHENQVVCRHLEKAVEHVHTEDALFNQRFQKIFNGHRGADACRETRSV